MTHQLGITVTERRTALLEQLRACGPETFALETVFTHGGRKHFEIRTVNVTVGEDELIEVMDDLKTKQCGSTGCLLGHAATCEYFLTGDPSAMAHVTDLYDLPDPLIDYVVRDDHPFCAEYRRLIDEHGYLFQHEAEWIVTIKALEAMIAGTIKWFWHGRDEWSYFDAEGNEIPDPNEFNFAGDTGDDED